MHSETARLASHPYITYHTVCLLCLAQGRPVTSYSCLRLTREGEWTAPYELLPVLECGMVKTQFLALTAIALVWIPIQAEPFPPGNGSSPVNWSQDPEFTTFHHVYSMHPGFHHGTPYAPIFRVGSGAGMSVELEETIPFQSDWAMFNRTELDHFLPDIAWDPFSKLQRRLQEHSPFVRLPRTINAAKMNEHSSSSYTVPHWVFYTATNNIQPPTKSSKFLEPRPQAEGQPANQIRTEDHNEIALYKRSKVVSATVVPGTRYRVDRPPRFSVWGNTKRYMQEMGPKYFGPAAIAAGICGHMYNG